jgi:hypothetical protein
MVTMLVRPFARIGTVQCLRRSVPTVSSAVSVGQTLVSKRCLHNKFWAWTTQPRPDWKKSPLEAAVLFVVFGITGSSSVALVRPALKHTIGLEGSLMEGPNSYRVLSFILVSPIYACVLLTVVRTAILYLSVDEDNLTCRLYVVGDLGWQAQLFCQDGN